ncbi:hypothetical protein R1sor_000994 [Riccia sorocarpa]|uniref:Calmodulin-binding heat-shock protein n=1 Tax=Riccia sorocarpa TaxID=122646 RepID=A0ABD3GXV1_9MARC
MSLACGVPILECVALAGCCKWAWKRCTYIGAYDSENWALASYEEFETIPRICRIVLAVYEHDLTKPKWAPPGGYGMKLEDVIKRVSYDETGGRAPPYLIYVDHEASDIILAIRGLNLGKNRDYRVLLNNKLGKKMFDGGYVHHGLLKAAGFVLDKESATLVELIQKYPEYTVTFAGHSLGAGVVSLMTVVVIKNRKYLGNISRERLRCYSIAPARCMSLNLAVNYADVINSVILQDDFLPRTSTPLQDIFGAVLCLPCLLCCRCMLDTFTSEKKKLKDPRRLYAPGTMYHMVERRFCSCGRFPPEVRSHVPVDGRFEHVVLSCNATSDHSLVNLERISSNALDVLKETLVDVPLEQRMEKKQSNVRDRKQERKSALERAVTLNVPHAFSPEDGVKEEETDENAIVVDAEGNRVPPSSEEDYINTEDTKKKKSPDWNSLIDRLFHCSGNREHNSSKSSGEEVEDEEKGEGFSYSRNENQPSVWRDYEAKKL